MRANEYQQLAARTINHDLDNQVIEEHALFGMAGEVGEIHSLDQKVYQGHLFEEEHGKKELGE